MTELVICRGLPASGKTTWARAWVAEDRAGRARVSRDDLRLMTDDGVFVSDVTEPRVALIRDAGIEALLRKGVSVVSDDVNLAQYTARELAKAGRRAGAEVRVQDFTHVPLEECLRRNAVRVKVPAIPGSAIRGMHERYVKGKLPLPFPDEPPADPAEIVPYVPVIGVKPAVIVDIDGTMALRGLRRPHDYSRVSEDKPNWAVIELVRCLYVAGYEVIFLSGRPDSCEAATRAWLNEHFGRPYTLHMRKHGDGRKDWIVKLEIFNGEIRERYMVLLALDDRDQVVELWRALGILCPQVAPGNF